MVKPHQIPVIDEHNPFYCPDVSPSSYLATLHKSLSKSDVSKDNVFLYSFARTLHRKFFLVDEEPPPYYHQDRRFVTARSRSRKPVSPLPTYSPPLWETGYQPVYPPGLISIKHEPYTVALDITPAPALKRKRSTVSDVTFSDLEGPTKRGRSFESIHDSSFDVSGKAERIFGSQFEDGSSAPGSAYAPGLVPFETDTNLNGNENSFLDRIRALEDQLYGPPLGSETPRGLKQLVHILDQILPGVGIEKRFYILEHLTHQKIANVLGNNGHLSARVLSALRTSEVKSLDLTASVNDADGLNIAGRDVFPVFSKPNSFLFLSKLVFSGTPIQDFDLVHLHHLPRLAKLVLDDTSIGNEAIFLLATLKRTLVDLSIASNPLIDDDATPALLLLSRLSYLSIIDTGIGMAGLRRLAETIYREDRAIAIEIPTVCEFYIDNMHSKYMINPTAPLIVEPTACASLSVSALKRNLAEHAYFNPTILTSGSKGELVARLQNILQTRKVDILVRNMMWGE